MPTTKRATPRSRPATYNTATRLARIMYGLIGRPHGWSLRAIQDELGISERTLLRYLAACRRELVGADGRPLLEVVRRGDVRLLRLAEDARPPSSTAYQALSFYFALTVFQFLDGTVLKEGADDLWQGFFRALSSAQQTRLAHFDRKFYTVPYLVKDYRDFDDVLDVVLRALVHEQRLRIEYAGLRREGETTAHVFDPYTLAMYRGGLYLIGRSQRYRKIVYLAVERIRRATLLDEHFEYPTRYSPETHTEGTFGIVEGEETAVEIKIRNREAAALIASRRLHRTQEFVPQPDGTTLLRLTVRGTSELGNWILGLGPSVEVLAPPALRADVAAKLRDAAALYGPAGAARP